MDVGNVHLAIYDEIIKYYYIQRMDSHEISTVNYITTDTANFIGE